MTFIPANKDAECRLLRHNSVMPTSHDATAAAVPISKLEDVGSALDYDDIPLLLPDESICFSFVFTKYPGLVHRVAGYPIVTYSNSMGERSHYRGEDTVITAGYTPVALIPQPIKFILIHCPSKVTVGEEFEVTIQLFNTTSSSWPLRLDCINRNVTVTEDILQQRPAVSPAEDPGLFFVGVTSRALGSIDPGCSMEFTVSLFAANIGLYDLPMVFAMHANTKEKYSSGKLCKVLVVDNSYNSSVDSDTVVDVNEITTRVDDISILDSV
jgi:hypothetical protein